MLNGVKTKCDVKKLDTQNDFNTGKKGRDVLRPIKLRLTILLDIMSEFLDNSVFTVEEKKSLAYFKEVSPDELAVGTLKKMNDTCALLCNKKKSLRSTLPYVSCPNPTNKDILLDQYYIIQQTLNLPIADEYKQYEDTIQTLTKMNHPYIDKPESLMEDLNSLVGNTFTDIKIIIVDEKKGYTILENTQNIQFYRITRGHPRFKVIL